MITHPEAHGADPADAFDFVAPSGWLFELTDNRALVPWSLVPFDR